MGYSNAMTYEPLKNGDEIRVIAPSTFMNKTDDRGQLQRAQGRLGSLGYKVTFGTYLESEFYLHTAKPEDRIEDLHDAYLDKNVKAILAYRGGWSSNDLLPLIDWDIIKSNPKPLIGFSDITALHNAIYAKTGHVGLLGPIFRTLGDNIGWEYTLNHLNALLKCEYPQELKASKSGVSTWRSMDLLLPGRCSVKVKLRVFYLVVISARFTCSKAPNINLNLMNRSYLP